AEVMARLLEDLSTLSTAEAGKLSLHLEEVSAGEIMDDALAGFRSQFEATGVELEVQAAADLPLLKADPVRLRQVLSNVIANALRHTPAGGSVTVSVEGDGADQIAFRVSDTGRGI